MAILFAEEGDGDAARDQRVVLQGHDGDVREVGVRPDGAAGAAVPCPVHIWQGDEDGLVPVALQRHVAGKLGWVSYHELPGTGHFLSAVPGLGDTVLRTLFG